MNRIFAGMRKNFGLLLFLLLFFSCEKDNPQPVDPPEVAVDLNESSAFEIIQQPSSSEERERLHKNLGAADFEPLGLMVKPNEEITISVEVPAGIPAPSLLMGTYSRNEWTYTPQEFPLTTTSPRTITNPTAESQLLYIRFTGANPGVKATVTVEGGWRVPFFVLGESTSESFSEQLKTYDAYVDVQLMGNRSIIVISKNIALRYLNQDWGRLLETLDAVVNEEEYISGLDNSDELHAPSANRYFLTETRDSRYWMAATNFRTFYNARDAVDFIADRSKLEFDGWGPWHEIGHQHQLSAITWNETVEVTVNIYSLAVERMLGQTSRLKRENRWDGIMAYLDQPLEDKNYNDPAIGPFLRLGLYQQLWLAYGDEFFIKLHKEIREEGLQIDLKQEKMGYLMRKASEVSGYDLSDFFRHWGFRVDESYYADVAALGLPQPEEDPAGLRE